MNFIVYCEHDAGSLSRNLGGPEYSYWFVLRQFRPLLERMGLVIFVRDPAREVDPLYRQFRARGEDCVFLCFEPPQKVPHLLECPTIPVFAWEFEDLPDEAWFGDPRNDWRTTLRATGRAITHSNHAVRVTRRAMGEDYPVACIPAPVWDHYARLADRLGPPGPPRELRIEGRTIDSRTTDLDVYASPKRRQHGWAELPQPVPTVTRTTVGGVVYTAVFNPVDYRKNWMDMLAAFVWALRDKEDATLVFKLTHFECRAALGGMLEDMAKLSPFKCRVLLIDGFLDIASYDALVAATSFAVNASRGEGQCLPLMEFMSAGKPAIAPTNTAMADYIDPDCAFVVHGSREPCDWPHDERHVFRTLRWRTDFGSLVKAYAESYQVAKEDPGRYARMSHAATARQKAHCSQAVVEAKLADMLQLAGAAAE